MNEDFAAIREAQASLTKVGLDVSMVDPYVVTIANRTDPKTTLRITREQLAVLGQAAAALLTIQR